MLDDLLGGVTGTKSPQTAQEREDAAKRLTERCGYAAAALTLLPLPLTEYFAVMPIHVAMVMGIGHVYGVELTRESATQLLIKIGATVGLSLMGSRIATTAAKVLLPGLGGILGAPFMYASTIAIGMVARVYFETQGSVSEDDMRKVYAAAKKNAQSSFDPAKAKANEAKAAAEAAAAEAKRQEAAGPAAKTPVAAAAAAASSEPQDPVARLERLKGLKDKGLIDQGEFDVLKKKILAEL